jgi:hypothetical protein
LEAQGFNMDDPQQAAAQILGSGNYQPPQAQSQPPSASSVPTFQGDHAHIAESIFTAGFDPERRLEEARRRAAAGPGMDSGLDWWARRSAPFLSTMLNMAEQQRGEELRHGVERGSATTEEMNEYARHERMSQDQANQHGWQAVGSGLAHIPAMAGEAWFGGAAVRGLGAIRGLGFLAPVAEKIPRAATAASYLAPLTSPSSWARTAATTGFMPSMWAPEWVNSNLQAGRSQYDLRGLPAAFAVGAIQVAILGSLGKLAPNVGGEGLAGMLARTGIRGGIGVGEQEIADAITNATGLTREAGIIGQWRAGHHEGAVETAVIQGITMSVFAAMHGHDSHPIVEAETAALRALRRQGLSRPEAARRVESTIFGPLKKEMQGNPDLNRLEVMRLYDNVPEGPLRELADRIATVFDPAKPTEGPLAGPEPGIDRSEESQPLNQQQQQHLADMKQELGREGTRLDVLGEPGKKPFFEPLASLSDEQLREAANRPALPMPGVEPGSKLEKQIGPAWDIVSRLWPEMASKLKVIRSFTPEELAKEPRLARATGGIHLKNGDLALPPDHPGMPPEILWHELVHLEQHLKGKLGESPHYGEKGMTEYARLRESEAHQRGNMQAARLIERFNKLRQQPAAPENVQQPTVQQPQQPQNVTQPAAQTAPPAPPQPQGSPIELATQKLYDIRKSRFDAEAQVRSAEKEQFLKGGAVKLENAKRVARSIRAQEKAAQVALEQLRSQAILQEAAQKPPEPPQPAAGQVPSGPPPVQPAAEPVKTTAQQVAETEAQLHALALQQLKAQSDVYRLRKETYLAEGKERLRAAQKVLKGIQDQQQALIEQLEGKKQGAPEEMEGLRGKAAREELAKTPTVQPNVGHWTVERWQAGDRPSPEEAPAVLRQLAAERGLTELQLHTLLERREGTVTLQDIADAEGVTREAIRGREERAMGKLGKGSMDEELLPAAKEDARRARVAGQGESVDPGEVDRQTDNIPSNRRGLTPSESQNKRAEAVLTKLVNVLGGLSRRKTPLTPEQREAYARWIDRLGKEDYSVLAEAEAEFAKKKTGRVAPGDSGKPAPVRRGIGKPLPETTAPDRPDAPGQGTAPSQPSGPSTGPAQAPNVSPPVQPASAPAQPSGGQAARSQLRRGLVQATAADLAKFPKAKYTVEVTRANGPPHVERNLSAREAHMIAMSRPEDTTVYRQTDRRATPTTFMKAEQEARKLGQTVWDIVRRRGGISEESAANSGLDVKVLKDDMPSLFKDIKGRKGTEPLDRIAKDLHAEGHILSPDPEHLIQQIENHALTIHADTDKFARQEEAKYFKLQQELQADAAQEGKSDEQVRRDLEEAEKTGGARGQGEGSTLQAEAIHKQFAKEAEQESKAAEAGADTGELTPEQQARGDGADSGAGNEPWDAPSEPVPSAARVTKPEPGEPAGGGAREVGGTVASGAPGMAKRLVALANAQVDAERRDRGQEAVLAQARQSDPEIYQKAMDRLADDPKAAENLVNELQKKPRNPDAVENMLLIQRMTELRNERDRTAEQLSKARQTGADAITISGLENRAEEVAKQIDQIDKVVHDTGSETGRAFRLRRLLMNEEYSLEGMLRTAEQARGRPLNEQEKQKIAAMAQKIAALQQQLAAAQEAMRKAGTGAKGPEFAEVQKVTSAVESAKGEFHVDTDTAKENNKPVWQQYIDLFQKFRVAEVISSPVTLMKIMAASKMRPLISTAEEAIGSQIAKFPGLSKIAAMAPREGRGFSLEREKAAFMSEYGQGMIDAVQRLKSGTGLSPLDIQHGTRQAAYPENWRGKLGKWLDYVGVVHAAVKDSAVRSEYTRSFLSRLDWRAAHGLDISQPESIAHASMEAYINSARAKFQQSNWLVDKMNNFFAAGKNATLGQRALNIVGTTLLPIRRVPTNIVAEAFEYSFGSVTGGTKAALALKKGMSQLTPPEADAIMRSLKKGSLGAACLLLGYFAPKVIGGFYSGKRREDEVKAGNIGPVPSYLLHNPMLEVLQMGSTFRRTQDKPDNGFIEGLLAGVAGQVREMPLTRQAETTAQLVNPRESGKAFGELAKSLAVPQFMQWIAGKMDQNDQGDPTQRRPQGIMQNVESGIPGLRNQVPAAPRPGQLRPLQPLRQRQR